MSQTARNRKLEAENLRLKAVLKLEVESQRLATEGGQLEAENWSLTAAGGLNWRLTA